MNKKKLVIYSSLIILFLITFSIFAYIIIKNGNNNINKSEEKIVDNILNLKTYNSKIEIEIQTNKNHNKYIIKQSVNDNNICKQEVLEPENISGLVTEYDGKNLKISNNKLNLEKIFENYNYIIDNNLWLNSFINDYKLGDNTKITQKDDEVVLEVKIKNGNKYNYYKKLYISKTLGKPTKMIIQDINQKSLVNILYTEIEIS